MQWFVGAAVAAMVGSGMQPAVAGVVTERECEALIAEARHLELQSLISAGQILLHYSDALKPFETLEPGTPEHTTYFAAANIERLSREAWDDFNAALEAMCQDDAGKR